jgi:hypothetical protein
MKALACPMPAYEFSSPGGKAPCSARFSDIPGETVAGSSQLWYHIGFGLGLAFSLAPNWRESGKETVKSEW